MKALIGIDGSAGSLQAARFAGRLLSENDEIRNVLLTAAGRCPSES